MDLEALLSQYAPSLTQGNVQSEIAEFTAKEQEWLDRQADDYLAGIESAKLARLYWLTVGLGLSSALTGIVITNLVTVPLGIVTALIMSIGTVLASPKRWVGLTLSGLALSAVVGYSGHYNMVNRTNIYQAKTSINPVEADNAVNVEAMVLGIVLVFGILCVLPHKKKANYF